MCVCVLFMQFAIHMPPLRQTDRNNWQDYKNKTPFFEKGTYIRENFLSDATVDTTGLTFCSTSMDLLFDLMVKQVVHWTGRKTCELNQIHKGNWWSSKVGRQNKTWNRRKDSGQTTWNRRTESTTLKTQQGEKANNVKTTSVRRQGGQESNRAGK